MIKLPQPAKPTSDPAPSELQRPIRPGERIFIASLGCSKAQVESESLLAMAKAMGGIWVDDAEDADVLVVNTCSFIEASRRESIDTIIEAQTFKKPGSRLIVAGCLVEHYGDELRQHLTGVDQMVSAHDLVHDWQQAWQAGTFYKPVSSPWSLPGSRFLKISEGCNRRCSFCTIPRFKGDLRSYPLDDLLAEASGLVDAGAKELVLVAQDLTDYGKEWWGRDGMVKLLQAFDAIEDLHWLRLMYAYPSTVTDAFIEAMAQSRVVVPYLDVPLQHLSDPMLKRMRRVGNYERYRDMVARLRKAIPDIAIRTTLMVGFPGETEDDHTALVERLQELELDHVGIFTYSQEDDTPAPSMGDAVPDSLKKERQAQVYEVQAAISASRNERYFGKVLDVLIEEIATSDADGEVYGIGRSAYQAPEVDGCVTLRGRSPEPGRFAKVRIDNTSTYDQSGIWWGGA